MQSHRDDDIRNLEQKELLASLNAKATRLTATGGNLITAGEAGEQPLRAVEAGGFYVAQRAADPDGVLRISIGEAKALDGSSYLVFRGHPAEINALLVRARDALKASGLS